MTAEPTGDGDTVGDRVACISSALQAHDALALNCKLAHNLSIATVNAQRNGVFDNREAAVLKRVRLRSIFVSMNGPQLAHPTQPLTPVRRPDSSSCSASSLVVLTRLVPHAGFIVKVG